MYIYRGTSVSFILFSLLALFVGLWELSAWLCRTRKVQHTCFCFSASWSRALASVLCAVSSYLPFPTRLALDFIIFKYQKPSLLFSCLLISSAYVCLVFPIPSNHPTLTCDCPGIVVGNSWRLRLLTYSRTSSTAARTCTGWDSHTLTRGLPVHATCTITPAHGEGAHQFLPSCHLRFLFV